MSLAVVVPTLNEEMTVEVSLRSAQAVADLVVVADGGSQDATLELAQEAGVYCLGCEPGRGLQLNAGANEAIALGCDALLFLHADTTLPHEARQAVHDALAGGALGGGFLVRFDRAPGLMRFAAPLINGRTRLLKMPLGDQAQFVSRSAFERTGGFKPWPILEDLDFILRLRRLGPVAIVPHTVTTAARRFVERGVLRTVVTNWLIWLLFALGVSPSRLSRLYRQVR